MCNTLRTQQMLAEIEKELSIRGMHCQNPNKRGLETGFS